MTAPAAGSGLDPLFRPRVVAVVGASRSTVSIGGAIFRNLIQGGFTGTVYPVNAGATAVQGVRAFPSLEALPERPDLVVVAVPAVHVPAVVAQAAKAGAGAAILVSAGFADVGEKGRQVEQELTRVARQAGMRLLGPNCLGVQNLDPAIRLNATFATTFGAPGAVAFASQSGALGVVALDHSAELGIGFSSFLSLGNKADIVCTDVMEHFEHDEGTKAILFYLESFADPKKVREVAERVGRRKPIALVKSGRTGAGARAAGSHTGAMVGPDAAVTALCTQAGILRVDTIEQLFSVAGVLAHAPSLRGRNVAVVTNAGGPGILAADALEAAGLVLPPLSPASQEVLRRVLRPESAVANPVDVLADVTPPDFGRAMEVVLADPAVDAVVALYVPPVTGEAVEIAHQIVRASAGVDKPIVANFQGIFGVPQAISVLHAARIPSVRFPEQAAHALGLAARYVEWRDRPLAEPRVPPPTPPAATQAVAAARARLGAQGGWMNAQESAALCEAWRLSIASQRRTPPTPDAAAAAAAEVGFPAVLKAEVPGITHKSDLQGVVLGLATPEAVRAAATRMGALRPEAFLVQQQISGGQEWLVGVVRHEKYGPLVAVGAGGLEAELRRDVHYRLAPLTPQDVHALVSEPRIGKTLPGWRGRPPGDGEALERFVTTLSWCALAHPEIGELEANPVKVLTPGQGAVAVDVRVHLLPAASAATE